MKVEAASHEDKTAYFETIYRPSSELDGTDVAPMKSTANPDIMMSRRSTPFHVHQKENKTETQFKASQLKHGTPIIESSRSFFLLLPGSTSYLDSLIVISSVMELKRVVQHRIRLRLSLGHVDVVVNVVSAQNRVTFRF